MVSTFGYATIAQVRAFNPSGTKTDMSDANLEEFISRAEAFINEYAGQEFTSNNVVTEVFSGDNSNWVVLENFPIQKILRINIDDVELDPKFARIDMGGKVILSREGTSSFFPTTRVDNVVITYMHGSDNVPLTVTNATVLLSSIYADNGNDGVIQSQSDGQVSISAKVGKDLSMLVADALNAIGRGALTKGMPRSTPQAIQLDAHRDSRLISLNR